MKPFSSMVVPAAAAFVMTVNAPAMAAPAEDVQNATRTFQEFVSNADRRIPPALLQESQAIAIIPNVIRAGFIFGGRRGDGVLLVRKPDGSWSDPAFVNITGGSIGLQAGAQASDVILVFRNQQNVARLLEKKVELGGDISVAAGPIGKDYLSAADPSPVIYSYTRNRGLFGGIAISGVNLSYDRDQTEEYYGQENIAIRDVLSSSRTPQPPEVASLKATLSQYATVGRLDTSN
jgi:SH3 domain-containing YSC84-like protein 1